MRFGDTICLAALAASVAAAPMRNMMRRQDGSFDGLSFEQIDALTPPFGHDANVNPTGTGDCDGAVNGADGNPIKIPCACPPDRTTFINSLIANLNAGQVVNNPDVGISFPTDDSVPSIQARFNAASVTLQNLNGPGQGCPQVSTTWTAQLNAILSGASTSIAAAPAPSTSVASPPPPASPSTTEAAPAAPSSTSTGNGAGDNQSEGFDGLSFEQIDALTPPFGHDANVNPTGTGDCDGAVNGPDGSPVKVPCACPPDRTLFINDLIANVKNGRVVNNTDVGISFPTDDSIPSIQARFNAATVTLQNLEGPGRGCPQAATTWGAQLNAILSGASTSIAAAPAPSTSVASPPPSTTEAPAAPSSTSTDNGTGENQSEGFDGLSFEQIDALTPPFGHDANVNPTGTGDCDGAVNGPDGSPVKVPCACPPDRTLFINDLIANVKNGRVVNNTDVGISFPTDDSIPSIQARFNAATVTLQNLEGPGRGCPQAATTWGAQLNEILNGAKRR